MIFSQSNFVKLIFYDNLDCSQLINNSSENEDEATHVVFPSTDPSDEEYVRPVFRNKEKWTLLHWYYFPESYDSWVNTEIHMDLPDAPPPYNPNAKWKVRFIWKSQYLFL